MSASDQNQSIPVNQLPPEFWERVDKVIELANDQAKQCSIGEMGLSLIYAVARYNAFEVARTTGNKQTMESAKEEAIQHFITQYDKMLNANMDDYIGNYDSYLEKV